MSVDAAENARDAPVARPAGREWALGGDDVKIIALDFATCTGFAVARAGVFIASGTMSFKPKRGDSPGMRWIIFRRTFNELLNEQEPDLVVWEQPFIGAIRSATVAEWAFGLCTRAQEICDERKIDYRSVQNSVIKQFATGNGNANKDAMKASAVAKWPNYDPAKDPGGDEADACHLMSYCLAGFPDLAAAKAEAVAADRAAAKAEKDHAASARAAALRALILAALPLQSQPCPLTGFRDLLGSEYTLAETRRCLEALKAERVVVQNWTGWGMST